MRERVRRLAARMGYRPNPLVSALMSQVREKRVRREGATIAIVDSWPGRERPIWSWQTGIEKRARELGGKTELFSLHREGMTPERLAEVLWARQILRVVFLPFAHSGYELKMPLERVAAVCIGHTLRTPVLHRVAPHQYQHGMEACERLHALGYRRIGLVQTSSIDARVAHQWMAAFLAWEQARGRRGIPPCLIDSGRPQEGERIFRRWATRHRPDVVLDGCSGLKDVDRGDWAYATLQWTAQEPHRAGIDQRNDLIAAAAVDVVTAQAYLNDFGVPAAAKLSVVPGMWRDGVTAPPLCL